ncbi:MAG: hypothetical protein JWP97_3905 [Labilithrix sp.]|nr:hypothetical protein [Labilithrix sp.]
MTTTTTAWGTASVLEQVEIKQRAGDRAYGTLVQLLEDADGMRLVRFAYTTDGRARRGPVTLRLEDLAKLRKGLARAPKLQAALGFG